MNPTAPTADIRDIKGLVPIPMGRWWIWVLIAVLLVAATAWLIWWLRKRRQPKPISRRPPASPYDLALQAFRRLLEDKLIERNQVEEFYTRLSGIVRGYLEGRFQLHAPDRTTEEFLREVSRDPSLTTEHKELLGAFLEESDLVKFARFRPGAEDMKRALDAAERFTHETRPRLQEEAGTP